MRASLCAASPPDKVGVPVIPAQAGIHLAKPSPSDQRLLISSLLFSFSLSLPPLGQERKFALLANEDTPSSR
jgi:hypothetical protein